MSSGSCVRQAKRRALYDRDGHRCAYCGVDVVERGPYRAAGYVANDANSRTLDHLDADRSNNDSSNLITACRSCNSRKGTRTLEQYAADAYPDDPQLVARVRKQASRSIVRRQRAHQRAIDVELEVRRRLDDLLSSGIYIPNPDLPPF
jgi:hypothetical protein